MEIQVNCRNPERKTFMESCAKFFSQKLNLQTSNFTINIYSKYRLKQEEDSNGLAVQIFPKSVNIYLDNRLPLNKLMVVLAHEMVHAKQIAKGQLKGHRSGNGRIVNKWCGRVIMTSYLKRPWEKEAINRQYELVEDLIKYVTKKNKKG